MLSQTTTSRPVAATQRQQRQAVLTRYDVKCFDCIQLLSGGRLGAMWFVNASLAFPTTSLSWTKTCAFVVLLTFRAT
jgi:hypothetical protein